MTEQSPSPRAIWGLSRGHAVAVVAIAAGVMVAVVFGSCAKSPTSIVVQISVDDTVPPVLELRATVVLASNPSQVATSVYSSLYPGDASDRPAPYVFPLSLPLSVPPGWTGGVTVTVEGIDWYKPAVVTATGSTTVDLVPQHPVPAMLTLTGVGGGGTPDGGIADDGGSGGADAGEDVGEDDGGDAAGQDSAQDGDDSGGDSSGDDTTAETDSGTD